jgi:hypothetical protein
VPVITTKSLLCGTRGVVCGEYSTSIVAEKQLKQHMKILFIKSINGTGVRLEWRKDVNPTAISRAAVYPPAIS